MKCDLCGLRTAVVFVQESSPSSRKELHLCAECAKIRGFDRVDGDLRLSISDLFSSLSEGSPRAGQEIPPERCPLCACTLNELKQRGLASCPACYQTFAFELFRSAYPDARSRRHAGRVPRRLNAGAGAAELLTRAREELKDALIREDYEAAARCRDLIRSLGGGEGDHV